MVVRLYPQYAGIHLGGYLVGARRQSVGADSPVGHLSREADLESESAANVDDISQRWALQISI